jgi:hypothetical protein
MFYTVPWTWKDMGMHVADDRYEAHTGLWLEKLKTGTTGRQEYMGG